MLVPEEDAIPNSQDSVVTMCDSQDKEELVIVETVEKEKKTYSNLILQQPETRKSERLMKTIGISTQEKNEKMAKKRNLEGNTNTTSMFSELHDDTLKQLSSDMGILVDKVNFATFDMLKELEIARNNLHSKHQEAIAHDTVEEVVQEDDVNLRLIEWLQDDVSDTESDILAQSKNKGKLSKRKLKISPNGKKRHKTRKFCLG